MFFLTGICAKVVVKNRDGADTRRDAHPLGSVTLTHPGAASALFRYRRDVRHPSFGGGARLQRASTPPAVVRVERGRFALFASPLNLSRDRIRRSADTFAWRPHDQPRIGDRPRDLPGRHVRVCCSQRGTATTDNLNHRSSLWMHSRLREQPATWTVDCRWDRVERGRAALEVSSEVGSKFSERCSLARARVSSAANIFMLFEDNCSNIFRCSRTNMDYHCRRR